jgi:DNA-binding beta-propeller fold protein YncE
MRKLVTIALACACALVPLGARAGLQPRAAARLVAADRRVIVSSTLNDELQVFGASSLAELQPAVLSKGAGPVRLWVQAVDAHPYLFVANHGAEGSLGVFDLAGAQVSELPLSPFPARAGSVGVAGAGHTMFVTNTWQALGGCGLPAGSVTAFDLSKLASLGLVTETGTVDVTGAIPYGVAAAANGRAFVSSNCSASLDTIDVSENGVARTATRATGAGPDGVIFDPLTNLVFVNNITASSVSVFDSSSGAALTTVPMPGAHPIDSNLADSASGARWLVTSNGGDDSVGLVDRAVVAECVAARAASCPAAYVARIPTKVAGGAPEGVDYDPASGRIFTVNKTPYGAPSLSVIQVNEGDLAASTVVANLPLGIGPVPAVTSFDVVVAGK